MTGLQCEKRMKGQTYTSKGRATSSQESDHAGRRQAFKVPAPADNSQKRSGGCIFSIRTASVVYMHGLPLRVP